MKVYSDRNNIQVELLFQLTNNADSYGIVLWVWIAIDGYTERLHRKKQHASSIRTIPSKNIAFIQVLFFEPSNSTQYRLTLSHLQIAYALVWLHLHSRHWKYPVYLHSQEEKHRNANTIIEIVVTRKVYNLHLTNFTRCTSRLYTTHKCWSMCMKLMF